MGKKSKRQWIVVTIIIAIVLLFFLDIKPSSIVAGEANDGYALIGENPSQLTNLDCDSTQKSVFINPSNSRVSSYNRECKSKYWNSISKGDSFSQSGYDKDKEELGVFGGSDYLVSTCGFRDKISKEEQTITSNINVANKFTRVTFFKSNINIKSSIKIGKIDLDRQSQQINVDIQPSLLEENKHFVSVNGEAPFVLMNDKLFYTIEMKNNNEQDGGCVKAINLRERNPFVTCSLGEGETFVWETIKKGQSFNIHSLKYPVRRFCTNIPIVLIKDNAVEFAGFETLDIIEKLSSGQTIPAQNFDIKVLYKTADSLIKCKLDQAIDDESGICKKQEELLYGFRKKLDLGSNDFVVSFDKNNKFVNIGAETYSVQTPMNCNEILLKTGVGGKSTETIFKNGEEKNINDFIKVKLQDQICSFDPQNPSDIGEGWSYTFLFDIDEAGLQTTIQQPNGYIEQNKFYLANIEVNNQLAEALPTNIDVMVNTVINGDQTHQYSTKYLAPFGKSNIKIQIPTNLLGDINVKQTPTFTAYTYQGVGKGNSATFYIASLEAIKKAEKADTKTENFGKESSTVEKSSPTDAQKQKAIIVEEITLFDKILSYLKNLLSIFS